MVTVGWPITVTRGLGTVGCAWPPWLHITVAPTWSRKPGIASHHDQRAVIDGDGRAGEHDGRLAVGDDDAGLAHHDARTGRARDRPGAQGHASRWSRQIADHQHVLQHRLQHDVRVAGDAGERYQRHLRGISPPAAGPYRIVRIAALELDP